MSFGDLILKQSLVSALMKHFLKEFLHKDIVLINPNEKSNKYKIISTNSRFQKGTSFKDMFYSRKLPLKIQSHSLRPDRDLYSMK